MICGYDRHLGALQFHHIDPGSKRSRISQTGMTLSLESMRAEARKCVLLCSNCHAEVEAGVVSLPLHLAGRAAGPRQQSENSLDQYTMIRGNSIGRISGC